MRQRQVAATPAAASREGPDGLGRPVGRRHRPVGLGDVEGVDGLAGQRGDVGRADRQPPLAQARPSANSSPLRSPVRTSITAALALAPGTASTNGGAVSLRCAARDSRLRTRCSIDESPSSSRSSSCTSRAGSGTSVGRCLSTRQVFTATPSTVFSTAERTETEWAASSPAVSENSPSRSGRGDHQLDATRLRLHPDPRPVVQADRAGQAEIDEVAAHLIGDRRRPAASRRSRRRR